jgi:hypothetical protein
MEQVYASVDIEASGRNAVHHGIVQIGVQYFTKNTLLNNYVYTSNLVDELRNPDSTPSSNLWDYQTKNWYMQLPKDTIESFINFPKINDEVTMLHNFVREFLDINEKYKHIIPVAYPVGYDWHWLHTRYNVLIGDICPLPRAALDIRSYAAGLLRANFWACGKSGKLKKFNNNGVTHTHNAGDDAKEQALLLMRLFSEGN